MELPPANADEAVTLLIDNCPELLPAWTALSQLSGEATGQTVGIYNVFCHVVMPLLLFALDGHGRAEEGKDWPELGAGHRSTFTSEPQWASVPKRGSPALADLVRRLYAVLDLWAASPDEPLRSAVYVEMVETGYVDLTANDLLQNAGPTLAAMARPNLARWN